MANLPSVPDERLADAIIEVESRDENVRSLVQALGPMLDSLTDHMFQIVRMQAHTNVGLAQLNKARRGTLYWQLLVAVEIRSSWLYAREMRPDPSALEPLLTALTKLGLSGEAIQYVVGHLLNNADPGTAGLEMVTTISAAVHPFVGAMAWTGLHSLRNADEVSIIMGNWEKLDMVAVVKPYIEAALGHQGDRAAINTISCSMAEALAAEG